MKIAVIGMGAIGGLVAATLRANGVAVITVGRLDQKKAVERDGFIIDGVRGRSVVYFDIKSRLEEKVDLAILTVKTQDLRDAVDKSRDYLDQSLILTTQNGVRADKLLSMMLNKESIISSIVMFGATYEPFNKVVHNFEGNWLIGRPFGPNDEKVKEIVEFLKIAFTTIEVENISDMKWTKIFVNFSNCLPAILGLSMQEAYANIEICKLALRLLKEGFDTVENFGINLVDMPDFDVEKLKGLTRMPLDEAAPIYSGIMTNLSKEPLYGSILQSIRRGRPSEIDFINGEIANQAKLQSIDARLNNRAAELVHHVETSKKFLTVDEVLAEMAKTTKLKPGDFV